MPKPIAKDAAPSNIARLLNPDVAASVLSPAAPAPTSASRATPLQPHYAAPERRQARHIKREFILTAEADATFETLLAAFRNSTRSRTTGSQVFRAMLIAMQWALPAIQLEAHRAGALAMPSNARTNRVERQEYDEHLAIAISTAMRGTAPLNAGADEAARSRDRTGR